MLIKEITENKKKNCRLIDRVSIKPNECKQSEIVSRPAFPDFLPESFLLHNILLPEFSQMDQGLR